MTVIKILNQLLKEETRSDSNLNVLVAKEICAGKLKTIELIQALDPILTHADHATRFEGVVVLVNVIVSLPNNLLNEKEIQVLCEFLCLRLVDHGTMVIPVLNCLSYFINCDNKPNNFNRTLLDFLKTKTNVQRMEARERFLVYQITKKILVEKHQISASLDSDLLYSLIHMIEGESNPQNLLLCFGLVSYVMKNFTDLEPFIDDLFEWLASYYPIDYTPSESDGEQGVINILRSDLVGALYECFYANNLNSANLQTLLIEKLDSNLLSTKIESLNCLIRCYEIFDLRSIKEYASSLWTSIRMDCLKKITLVDEKLLETSYRALNALTRKLSEDDEIYFRFISDMYEELSIAFRKPEMDLFEAAARLIANAVQFDCRRFHYIVDKLVPIVINALSLKEMRTVSGLTYVFEKLWKSNADIRKVDDLKEPLNLLVRKLAKNIIEHSDCPKLLNAIIRCKVDLDRDTLNELIEELIAKIDTSVFDLELCLALICDSYNRIDIISSTDTKEEYGLVSLIKIITEYDDPSSYKFSVSLRLLIIKLQEVEACVMNSLNEQDISKLLLGLRAKAMDLMNQNIVCKVAKLHAIILNKLNQAKTDSLLLEFFSSNYCQKLIPENAEEELRSQDVYLPVVRWVLKSLVMKNHHMSAPLINLLLNFISSEKAGKNLAIEGSRVFCSVISDDLDFNTMKHRHVFALHKQKFYSQVSKEVRIRHDIVEDSFRRHLLICTLALLIPFVQPTVYKKDYEWMIRQLLKVMRDIESIITIESVNEELLSMVYDCLESLLRKDLSGNFLGLLNTLVDLDVKIATQGKTLKVRKSALDNLFSIASSFKDSELLLLRSCVVENTKSCLSDKKRIVRQAAAQARLKWILIGQPIGQ